MKKSSMFAVAMSAVFTLTGCWTVHHSEFPELEITKAPADQEKRVAIAGFDATLTTYLPIRTYSTSWSYGGSYYRRGRWHSDGYYPSTVSSTTYLPQTNQTTMFAERAADILEANGYVISPTNAEYIVEVRFSTAPVVTNGDRTKEALCIVCSLLTADYTARTWSARLSVRDNTTGRLILHKDYAIRGSAAVWGPIPILSPAAADDTSPEEIKVWCLTALTDMALADATAFIAHQ